MPLKNILILTYNDCSLFLTDFLLLQGPFWLNDKLLGFYMDYLENEVYSDLSVCFIRPEVTQCLKLYPDLNEFLDPLGFNSKDYAVMILNDCDDKKSAGGTHWSLLVFSKPEHTFYHIDSLHGHNAYCAKTLATKIAQYVGDNYVYRFHDTVTLKQRNSYDCGVFVLCNLDNVLKNISKNSNQFTIEPLTIEQVSKKRKELRNLIINMQKKENVNDSSKNITSNSKSNGDVETENSILNNIEHLRNHNQLQKFFFTEAENMNKYENEAKNFLGNWSKNLWEKPDYHCRISISDDENNINENKRFKTKCVAIKKKPKINKSVIKQENCTKTKCKRKLSNRRAQLSSDISLCSYTCSCKMKPLKKKSTAKKVVTNTRKTNKPIVKKTKRKNKCEKQIKRKSRLHERRPRKAIV
ncbi:hypothetical protein O3M35_000437 [Rhynocoris fuscipes]|uniref:Ubiquitin-like protease family profile domain-containing protein n=1 Tax=Rhynocoris fuscipes TaxID=488301 RepID=A0AAW1DMF5_9HEMI